MTLVYDRDGVQVYNAEALSVLRAMPDCSVHSVVCDPQYGLSQVTSAATIAAITAWVSGDRERVPTGRGFMGHDWDSFVPPPAIWDECLRVLTPGGHLLAFAGARTADLAGLSIRLAGFEVRDEIDVVGTRISWLYGTGMPKAKTILKPAHEPILVARKPFAGKTIAQAVMEHGTGGLNIEATKIPTSENLSGGAHSANARPRGDQPCFSGGVLHNGIGEYQQPTGRWPSNVVLVHTPLLDPETGEAIGDACAQGCQPECAVRELDAQSGTSASVRSIRRQAGASVGNGETLNRYAMNVDNIGGFNDSGGASRYFHCFRWEAKAPSSERPKFNGIAHPCVKPLSLMRWLVRLVTPQGGTALDWCAGSGTTGEAAQLEGFSCLLIERETKYVPHILSRFDHEEAIS